MSGQQTNSSLFDLSIPRCIIWATILYLALNWQGIIPVWFNAELPGPDDYLRVSRVRDWLGGQAWFDSEVLRFLGSDLHWSRIADIPIAALALLSGLLLGQEQALIAASILWPFLLFIVSALLLVRITDQLAGREARLFAILFAAFNTFTMVEFVPGRVDHHNLQMVLLLVAVAGLFERSAWKSALAVGICVPLSVAIGLEMLFLLAPILAGLGIAWAFGGSHDRLVFARTGLVMMVASCVFFLINVAPQSWFVAHCDAYSPFYAFLLIGAGAGFFMADKLTANIRIRFFNAAAGKVVVGGVIATVLGIVAAYLYPHCLAGPMEGLDPEAARRWLEDVTEAAGLLQVASEKPDRWVSGVGYVFLILVVGTWVTKQHWRQHPHLLTLLLTVLVCIAVSLIQVRVLRTGLIAVVPFLALFAKDAFRWIGDKSTLSGSAKIAVCVVLAAYSWSLAAKPLATLSTQPGSNVATTDLTGSVKQPGPSLRNPRACFGRHDFAELAKLPQGTVMSDLNSASPLLVHTNHSTISGPYHRNDREILAVYDFFQADADDARVMAKALGIDYVVTCRASGGIPVKDKDHLNARVWRGDLPQWLQWRSSPDARLAVLEVLP